MIGSMAGASERSKLVVQMRQLLKQTGPYTSFRRTDFGHDEEFIKKRWTGEPLLWITYSGGTHMMKLGGRTTLKQRDVILAVIDGMLQEGEDAHFFIIEGPRFPPREIPPRQIRDYIIDMMEAESRGEPFEDHREGLERESFRSNADYYVWPLQSGRNEPLAGYGPYGPYDLMTAKTFARARSQEGTHDNAVTRGQDPQRFELVRIYQAGTGQRLFPRGSEGFEANED